MKLGSIGGVLVSAALAFSVFAGSAQAVTITEFDANPGKLANPLYITSGPEGLLWWTETGLGAVGIMRMSPSGERLPLIATGRSPYDLVVAPSGWVSWTANGGPETRSPEGVVKSQNAGSTTSGPMILTPSNQIRWGRSFGESDPQVCIGEKDNAAEGLNGCAFIEGTVGRITGLGSSTQNLWASYGDENVVRIWDYKVNVAKVVDLPSGSLPARIAIGPEGDAWVAMYLAGAIDRIAPNGTRTRFLLPAGSEPNDIVLGPDGAFWIAEYGTNKITRMTTTGTITNEYPVPSANAELVGITVGPDGNIWFTEPGVGKIGRLVPDPLALPGDTVAPTFSTAPKFSPARFKVAGKGKAHASARGGAPTGTKLKFSLSEQATVTTTIARKVHKRKGGFRFVKVGKLSAGGKQGANAVPFNGKLKGKALAPGKYRATLSARDGAGNVSAPKTAGFAIVR